MLAQKIRLNGWYSIRPPREFDWHPGDIKFADESVPDSPHRPAVAQVRMGDGFVDGEDGRAGDAILLQFQDCGITAGESTKPFFDYLLQRLIVVPPRARRIETRIICQRRHPHGVNHL